MSKKDKNLITNLVKNFIIDENEFEYKNIENYKKSEKLFSYNKNRKLSNVEKRKRFFSENDSLNFVPKLKPKISNIKPTVLRLNTKKSNSRNVRENLFSDVDQPLINSYENEDTESFDSSSDSDTSDEEILIIKEEKKILERKVKKIKEELHECSDFESDEEVNKLRFLKTILQVRKELIKYKVKINKNFSYKDDTLIEIGKSKIYKILDISEYFFNNNNLNYNQNNVNNNYNQNKQRHLSILCILENKLSVK
jgi:hypothetical protein